MTDTYSKSSSESVSASSTHVPFSIEGSRPDPLRYLHRGNDDTHALMIHSSNSVDFEKLLCSNATANTFATLYPPSLCTTSRIKLLLPVLEWPLTSWSHTISRSSPSFFETPVCNRRKPAPILQYRHMARILARLYRAGRDARWGEKPACRTGTNRSSLLYNDLPEGGMGYRTAQVRIPLAIKSCYTQHPI